MLRVWPGGIWFVLQTCGSKLLDKLCDQSGSLLSSFSARRRRGRLFPLPSCSAFPLREPFISNCCLCPYSDLSLLWWRLQLLNRRYRALLPWYEPVAPADALSWEAWLAPALLPKHLIPLGSIFFVGSPETASQNSWCGDGNIFFSLSQSLLSVAPEPFGMMLLVPAEPSPQLRRGQSLWLGVCPSSVFMQFGRELEAAGNPLPGEGFVQKVKVSSASLFPLAGI